MARKNPNEFESIAEEQLAPDDLWLVWDASAGRLKKLLQPILAKASALANYYTKTQSDARYLQADDISGLGTGDMLGLHNLSELTDPAEARANLGLDEVDNTADLDKPVSTATQTALAAKLDASAYNDRFKGLYAALSALQAAHPAGAAGDYAQVDSGIGGAPHIYSWDASDSAWVLTSADGTGAANTDQLPEGSTNQYFTPARVGTALSSATAKTMPVDADSLALSDSEAGGTLKKLSWANLKTALGSIFATAAQGTKAEIIEIQAACSDENTPLAVGTGKVTFRTPCGFTLTAVRASLTVAQSSGSIFTVDVNKNGTSVLSTKLTIDNAEKTSTTAATAAVISDSSIADDAEISVDIDQIGDGTAKGLKITLLGIRT